MIIAKQEFFASMFIVLGVNLGSAWSEEISNHDRFAARVEKSIEEWEPTKNERQFDQIGWAKDIRNALRLAKEHHRPVFLFTYDGESLATYRC